MGEDKQQREVEEGVEWGQGRTQSQGRKAIVEFSAGNRQIACGQQPIFGMVAQPKLRNGSEKTHKLPVMALRFPTQSNGTKRCTPYSSSSSSTSSFGKWRAEKLADHIRRNGKQPWVGGPRVKKMKNANRCRAVSLRSKKQPAAGVRKGKTR
ncbi:hypothetical protein ZHAS_00010984 [Anopheles sinensis]|uniref:Uncharacterized protein n=1 Tax=Anopheles sinensis TaxID=74873 RepID=A0A084VZ12_ANOSI|nr:hypothetical protein ZHAS_00010984 [Anopheles sinensis]